MKAPTIPTKLQGVTRVDTKLSVPTRFAIPLAGQIEWSAAPGWKVTQPRSDFHLKPGQPLEIPLQAEVEAGTFAGNPTLMITFEPGHFRNRAIEAAPFRLGGPSTLRAGQAEPAPVVDGRIDDKAWKSAPVHSLLGLPPKGGRGDQVRMVANKEWLFVGATLDDPEGKVTVAPPTGEREGGRSVLAMEHVRLVLSDGKQTHTFALAPDQVRYHDKEDDVNPLPWHAASAPCPGGWGVEMAIPRKLFEDWSQVRLNVAHRRRLGREYQEMHLCPSFRPGIDPDRIPSATPWDKPDAFAPIQLE
jgi:hypothetical protein